MLTFALFLISTVFFLIFFGGIFIYYFWGEITIEQLFFHLFNPLIETNYHLLLKGICCILLPTIGCSILFVFPEVIFKKHSKFIQKLKKLRKIQLFFISILLILLMSFYFIKFSALDFFKTDTGLDVYTEHYINQKNLDIKFSEKRNLILIFMESMEKTYNNEKIFSESLIPNLNKLSTNNVSFDGYRQIYGTDYTVAGMYATLCGTPMNFNFKIESILDKKDTLNLKNPIMMCIPRMLRDNGYNTYYLMGTSSKVANIGTMILKSGYEKLFSKEDIQKEYKNYNQMQGSNWGISDFFLYEIAKEKLLEISKEKSPFFFTLATIDTHYPDGFFDEEHCQKKYDNFSDNVVCADLLVNNFINWVKLQSFYKDTTIIIVGDHLAKTNSTITKIKNENRSIVNIFINTSNKKNYKKNRKFLAIDLFPTILSSIGGTDSVDKIALGRNLFSNNNTLLEEFGEKIIKDLRKFMIYWSKLKNM